jgi:hypothetical protein
MKKVHSSASSDEAMMEVADEKRADCSSIHGPSEPDNRCAQIRGFVCQPVSI